MGISAFADCEPEIYNRGEKVVLNHNLIYENNQYYIHMDDLYLLGLSVSEENCDLKDRYVIESKDCLGIERTLKFDKKRESQSGGLGDDFIIYLSNTESEYVQDTLDLPVIVLPPGTGLPEITLTENNVSYYERAEKEIKLNYDVNIDDSINDAINNPHFTDKEANIIIDDEYYVSLRLIGEKLSHKYEATDNRIDLYITNEERLIFYTTVTLNKITVDDWKVDIYAAEKTGDGDELSDYTVLDKKSCTIMQNTDSTTYMVEISADKITDSKFYYIADFGGRYALATAEIDFSKVCNVLVYGWQKEFTYTSIINLPQSNNIDVTYTIYVSTDNGTYSGRGIVYAGETSSSCSVNGILPTNKFETWVIFDNHKYLNGYLSDGKFIIIKGLIASDTTEEYTAKLSKEIMCMVSLPEDYICSGEVEVELSLKKYTSVNYGGEISGNIQLGNGLAFNENDTLSIFLNNMNRTVTIPLYASTEKFKLLYKIKSDTQGLYKEGYYSTNGRAVSDYNEAKVFDGSSFAQMTLLKCKNIPINIMRPNGIALDSAVYGNLNICSSTGSISVYKQINSSDIPVIDAGESIGVYQVETAEDKTYTVLLNNISGDEHIYSSCYYVEDGTSCVLPSNRKYFSYNDDSVDLKLIGCYNISGMVESELENKEYTVKVKYGNCYGEMSELSSNTEQGRFSVQIPCDAEFYTLSVHTNLGVSSFYVSNTSSSNDESSATKISALSDRSDFIIKYLVQKPLYPIEISYDTSYREVVIKNTGDYIIENADVYIAYFENDKLKTVDLHKVQLSGGFSKRYSYDNSDSDVFNIKAFVWKSGSATPLATSSVCKIR